jgi:hypothetical protein
METRDIVLALLILCVGVGIFYLLDPTMAGLLKRQPGHREGFRSNDEYEQMIPESSPGVGVPTMYHEGGKTEKHDNEQAQYVVPSNISQNVVDSSSGSVVEGFNTLTPAPMPFKDAEKPANCYPKDQINPQELLPNDPNSKWAQVNPMGQGDIAGKNYLSAGALIGVNTIGQSMRNANYQLRSDPPNPQVKVSIWNQSTIEPDINRRALEIG